MVCSMAAKTDNGEHILLNKEYLQLMASTKHKVLRDKKDEFDSAMFDLRKMVPDMPNGMFEALFEPLIRAFKTEQEMVDFAKSMVYVYRLSQQVKAMDKELTVIDGVLDNVGDLSMASEINFDEFEVVDDRD